MSRRRLPPRLWLEPERRNDEGRVTHASSWIILDGKDRRRTQCGPGEYQQAAQALQEYLIELHSKAPAPRSLTADQVKIADVLRHYAEVKGPSSAEPKELARRLTVLLGWWGDLTLEDIDSRSCRRYAAEHTSHASARRELQDLRSACNVALADRLTRDTVRVTLPKKSKARSDALKRDQIAELVWYAYRKRERQTIHRGPRKGEVVLTKKRPTRHIARFILFGLYTGTRSRRVFEASFERMPGRPWIDVDNGVYYREALGEDAAPNKQAPSIRMPARLIAHCRRWRDGGHDPKQATKFLCEYKGKSGDTRGAFRRLIKAVMAEEGKGIVRHTLRHTAATWLLQDEQDLHATAGYLGMTTDVLIKTYGHHHPEYQTAIGDSFTSGRAGKVRKRA